MSGPTGAGEHHEFQPAFHDERDASSSLFDLRYLIGGLFTLYGIMLVVASFFVSEAKANGIDINLWLGLGMLILGVVFLIWARLRPLQVGGTSASARADQLAVERESGTTTRTASERLAPDTGAVRGTASSSVTAGEELGRGRRGRPA